MEKDKTCDIEVKPFSNATEAECWRADNCHKCKLYESESRSIEEAGCKLAFHIDLGFVIGEIPLWVAKEIGSSSIRQNEYVTLNLHCKQRQSKTSKQKNPKSQLVLSEREKKWKKSEKK